MDIKLSRIRRFSLCLRGAFSTQRRRSSAQQVYHSYRRACGVKGCENSCLCCLHPLPEHFAPGCSQIPLTRALIAAYDSAAASTKPPRPPGCTPPNSKEPTPWPPLPPSPPPPAPTPSTSGSSKTTTSAAAGLPRRPASTSTTSPLSAASSSAGSPARKAADVDLAPT